MSAELWRVLHDLQVAFVAVTCSHVSASVVELLMPQYSADRNKALQMVEGMLGVGFHWMLGVQLFRMLVPLASTNFPGTVFTVFAPMLLRHQYTKLLVAVQSLAGQTLRLLPTALGDDRGPATARKTSRGTVQPLTPDMSQWQQALDDLEKDILFEMRSVLAEAQAAYVDGNKERLDKENQLLRDVFNEGVADLTSLIGQGNAIGAELLDMAKARQNAVQQWQVQEKWQAFKTRAEQMASEVAIQLTAIEQSIEQMKAALGYVFVYSKNASDAADEWRKGGPPVIVPDDPPPADPSDPGKNKKNPPYPGGSGSGAYWVMGSVGEGDEVILARAQAIDMVTINACGTVMPGSGVIGGQYPLLYLVDESTQHLVTYTMPKFAPGSWNSRLRADYDKGLVIVATEEKNGLCTYPKNAGDTMTTTNYSNHWSKTSDFPNMGMWSSQQALLNNPPVWEGKVDGQSVKTFSNLYNKAAFVE